MKNCLLKLAVSGVLLGGAVAAQAGSDVGSWTVGAGVMWTKLDKDRGLDDNYGFDYEVGYAVNEHWDLALNGFSGNHDDLSPGATWDHEIKGMTIDFDFVFNRGGTISPFIIGGVGVVDQYRPATALLNQDKEVVTKLGAGATVDLTSWSGGKLQLKGDAYARGSVGRGIIDYAGTLGLQVAFGK
ncbi:MAG TPA: outer membrane beta-barrel protein [Steroidobacteraceae bacterium]|nr:outer membrane beta-barrel protein [Steroidobacteraceae bacterium]